MKKLSFISTVLVCAMGLSLALTACGETTKSADTQQETKHEDKMTSEEKKTDEKNMTEEKKMEAPAPGETGFTEYEVAPQVEVGPYIVAPVYFQPAMMYPMGTGVGHEDAVCHLEADIHLTPAKSVAFGFGAPSVNDDGEEEGAWPPYLSVTYSITNDAGTVVDEGTFMPMNAEDGPHYGANIAKSKLPEGKYKLKVTIAPQKDYVLHVDQETGVVGAKNNSEEYKEFYQTYETEFDWDFVVQW